MRRSFVIAASALAALTMVTLAGNPDPVHGQPLPTPPQGFKPPPAPPPAPIKPYAQVAVKPPAPFADASFEAFRKTLAAVAERKDRAALAKLVVAQGFFWLQDKNVADKSKSGIDNLAKAIGLDAKDGSGWDLVAAAAAEETAGEFPEQKGVMCAPALPTFDAKAFEAVLQATQTDPSEWAYPLEAGTEVRGAAKPNAPVIDKLGLYLVRALPDSPPQADANAPAFVHVALPSGKTGFVMAEALATLGSDQICYGKDASGWKIAGFIGGGAP